MLTGEEPSRRENRQARNGSAELKVNTIPVRDLRGVSIGRLERYSIYGQDYCKISFTLLYRSSPLRSLAIIVPFSSNKKLAGMELME